jgi:hypothetical protein
MVIPLRTVGGQLGTLSFALITDGARQAALVGGTYAYRLHVAGDIFSKGTVTVTNNGTAFAFVSDGGKEFTGKIEDKYFEFITGAIPADSEDDEAVSFQSAAVPATDEPVIPAQSILLDEATLEFNLGDEDALTAVLTATIAPADADTQVWWSSSKPLVAKVVPNGDGTATVTALDEGTATIRVKTVNGGRSAECAVTVVKPIESGLFFEENNDSLQIELPGEGTLLAEAITWLNATPGTGGFPDGHDVNYRILLGDAEGETTSGGYTLSKNITVTLEALSEEAGVISMGATGVIFTVLAGNTSDEPHLILDNNITLKGNATTVNNKPLLLIASTNNKGKVTMLDGSRITGNKSATNYCGGVQNMAKGTFIMEGGSIDSNTITLKSGAAGGVITVGAFTMKGGVIENNVVGNTTDSDGAPKGGGVLCYNTGTFTMSGGSIRNNELKTGASSGAGGQGGGVCARNFTMTTGTDAEGNETVPIIEGNTASRGGGIANYDNNAGTITIEGGIIRNNHATFENTGSAFERYNGANVRFIKTRGIIYGIDATTNSNCKENNVGQGYAIVLRNGTYSTAITYYRNDTAGDDVSLDSTSTGENSGWSTP